MSEKVFCTDCKYLKRWGIRIGSFCTHPSGGDMDYVTGEVTPTYCGERNNFGECELWQLQPSFLRRLSAVFKEKADAD